MIDVPDQGDAVEETTQGDRGTERQGEGRRRDRETGRQRDREKAHGETIASSKPM